MYLVVGLDIQLDFLAGQGADSAKRWSCQSLRRSGGQRVARLSGSRRWNRRQVAHLISILVVCAEAGERRTKKAIRGTQVYEEKREW